MYLEIGAYTEKVHVLGCLAKFLLTLCLFGTLSRGDCLTEGLNLVTHQETLHEVFVIPDSSASCPYSTAVLSL